MTTEKTLKEQLNGYIATGNNISCKKVYEDVKRKILQFDELLKNENIMSIFEMSQIERKKRNKKLRKEFKKIFGDFEK